MHPNAPNNITPQEYQQILQWRQQQQQQQQASPPPQQPVAFQSQHAPMSTDQMFSSMADELIQAYGNDAVQHLPSQVQQAPPPPPPQQPAAFQSQSTSMSVGQQIDNMADRLFQRMYNAAINRLQSEIQARVRHGRNQTHQSLPQYGGGPFQVQQPQFNQPSGFAAPQYGGGPFGIQQPQYNQPQSFTAPQLMAPPIPAPQQSFPPAESRSLSVPDGNWNPRLGEGALPGNQSPPVKLEPDDENNGANQSPPIKLEPDDESNGASRSIWSSAESVAEGRAIANTRHHAVEDSNELQRARLDLNLLAMPSRLGFGGG
ncbi:hypothetical protein KC349_g7233 [Hortaea werneckii]|nr:hypothetical protein KC349_g7233 [Hortaea werneckii]